MKPLDTAALMLTFAVCTVIVMAATDGKQMDGEQLEVYKQLLLAVIALLGAYFGSRLNK